MDTFDLIADERRNLAGTLAGLTGAQWQAPSRCDGWRTRDVLAHLVFPFEVSVPSLVVRMAKARLDFNRMSDTAARDDRRSPAELLAVYRANVTSRFTPPGAGPEAPLTDTVVHGADILAPLGVPHTVTSEALATVLGFVVSKTATRGFVARARVAGLCFTATDLDRSWGSGPVVRGPAVPLASAICGRTAAVDDLDGGGLDTFRARL
jgi:uncharacterized protein (TIGR03083 family)